MHALQHCRQPFEPHARVHRRLGQGGVVTIRIPVELHEDEIPDLDIAVAIGIGRPRRTTCNLGTMIIENLATGATGTGIAHCPEIITDADTGKPLRRYTDLTEPDIGGFVIFFKDRDPEFFPGQAVALGQQSPGVLDCLPFEVIAKTEVTQHLKEGVMASGVADIIEIVMLAACTHAPLGGDGPVIGPFLLSEKHILELHHPRVGKQQRGIVMGYQRAAWHDFVPICSEIIQKLLSDIPCLHT